MGQAAQSFGHQPCDAHGVAAVRHRIGAPDVAHSSNAVGIAGLVANALGRLSRQGR